MSLGRHLVHSKWIVIDICFDVVLTVLPFLLWQSLQKESGSGTWKGTAIDGLFVYVLCATDAL